VPVRYEFIGCVTNEASFSPLGQPGFGSETAAYYSQATQYAGSMQSPYFAVARAGDYGCGQLFSQVPSFPWRSASLTGCTSLCKDDRTKYCGSGDYFNDAGVPAGTPATSRVWAVYRRGDCKHSHLNYSLRCGLL
jgi:hypothetical protein